MHWRHAAAYITILLVGSLGFANADDTRLPDELKITPPDSSIPPEVAAFSGKWVGSWEDRLHSILVVQKIHPPDAKGAFKVEAIYSRGVHSPWFITTPGFRDVQGEIKDGQLTLWLGRANAYYRVSSPSTLQGEWHSGAVYKGTFQKATE